jgi:hypothetical protein
MSIREPWDVAQCGKSHLVVPRPESRDQSQSLPLPGRQAGDVQRDACDSVDLLIQALIDRLPKSNSMWSLEDRAKWLRALISAFDLVYDTSDQEQKIIIVTFADRPAYVPSVTGPVAAE